MKTALALLTGLVLGAPSALAHRVHSRSIMDRCPTTHPSRVETEVRVRPNAELLQIFAGAPLYLRVKFLNDRVHGPRLSETQLVPVDPESGFAQLRLETLSKVAGFHYRVMLFDWGVKDEQGAFFDLSAQFKSDIFPTEGEPCRTEWGSEADFAEKPVDPVL